MLAHHLQPVESLSIYELYIASMETSMAQTKDGRKFNRIQEYTRQGPNGPVKVAAHVRSNPITSKGKETAQDRDKDK